MLSRRSLFSLDFDRPRPTRAELLRVHRTAMACRVEVALDERDRDRLPAARAALDEADRVESLLTVFRETSELSRVNREAADGPVVVDPEVYALLRRCQRFHVATEGAFDITATPLSRCWGFLARQAQVPDPAVLEAARSLVGMLRVTFEDGSRTLRFERAGMQLNLGAVGKGYAVDRMAGVLRAAGVRHALVSAGSSSVIAVGGRGAGWLVDLRSPLVARARIGRLRLCDGAVGTSGPGQQFVIADGTRHGHVIDPRSGWPAQGILSATALATDCAAADALSTAFFVGGRECAERYCAAHPGTMAIVTVDDNEQTTFVYGQYPGARLEL